MKNIVAILFSLFIFQLCIGQVGINILIPDSSAVLHLEAKDKGFLPPRLTTFQRDNIVRPAAGLLIFNKTDSTMQFWNGRCWLRTYQRNCDECEFLMSLSTSSASIDRTSTDSAFTDISVEQTSGSRQTISLITLAGLPSGVTVYLDTSSIDSAGTTRLHVGASIFAPAGTYPIIIQAICGSNIRLQVFTVTIEPCIFVNLTADAVNYDLQLVNGLPGPGTPICVVINISSGANVTSAISSSPAYKNGNLDTRSHVGILNNGNILARGGDGAYGGGLSGFPPGAAGEAGGVAIDMSCKTTIINNGYIFGGGSGGGSVGLSFSFSIPIIGGSLTIGAGLGGGGGSANGQGGAAPSGSVIGVFEDGDDATGTVTSVPGNGGIVGAPIVIPISAASITITPSGGGGNGGGFGVSGAPGYLDLTLSFSITIPFVGTITVPIPIPGGLVPAFGPVSGPPGNAIKRNSNVLFGLTDGIYSTSFIKGNVGP